MQVFGLLAGIVVARVAGPSVVGVVSYGTSYVSLLAFISGLFGSAHIKLVSEGRDHGKCMAVYSRLQCMSSVLYLLATVGWFLIQKYVLRYPFESREVQLVILISLAAHFIDQYNSYSNVVYTAKLKQAKANLPLFFRSLAWHIGRVVIVFLGYKAITLSLWNLLLAILLVPFLYRLLKEYKRSQYDTRLAKEYFRYAVPILIIVVVNSITSYADKLLLAHYTNTTQLGYYSAAYSIGGMFLLIAMPVGSIFFPLFSSLIARGDWVGVNNNINKYQEFITLFIFPLITALAISGEPPLLLILGKRYQPSVLPFIVLLFSTYVVLWGLPYGNILTGMGKFYLSAWLYVIKLIVFVISITLFVSPKFLDLGSVGVALNLLVINLTANGLYVYYAKKLGHIAMDSKNIYRHGLIVLLAVGSFLLSWYLKSLSQYWWLAFLPIYVGLCYSFLWITRLMTKEDWLVLKDALNLKRTITYASDEMRGQ